MAIDDGVKREKELKRHQKVGKSFKKDVKEYEEELQSIEVQLMKEVLKLPNRTSEHTPIGDESMNKLLELRGEKPEFDFTPLDHQEIGEKFDLFDFDNATKLTGSKFVFMKNEAALMEMALSSWAMSKLVAKGFTAVTTPDITHGSVLEGCGFSPRDDSSQVYWLEHDHRSPDLCLIGTSEAKMAGMFANEIIEEKALPIKLAAFSHCFRKEAGKGGMSKGIYRLHQFSKVEMFMFSKPDESEKLHLELLEIEKEILDELGLHYKVLEMSSEELGLSAYRKFDIEAWFPARNDFGEVTSASNCTNFQTKRLNIQFMNQHGEKDIPHTLNGTAIAAPRVIMAILENYQTKEGTVKIPEPLRPFMGGIKEICTPRENGLI